MSVRATIRDLNVPKRQQGSMILRMQGGQTMGSALCCPNARSFGVVPIIVLHLYPAASPDFEPFTRKTPNPTLGIVLPELSFISLATGSCAMVCLLCARA